MLNYSGHALKDSGFMQHRQSAHRPQIGNAKSASQLESYYLTGAEGSALPSAFVVPDPGRFAEE
jgi:hypothetical protein